MKLHRKMRLENQIFTQREELKAFLFAITKELIISSCHVSLKNGKRVKQRFAEAELWNHFTDLKITKCMGCIRDGGFVVVVKVL